MLIIIITATTPIIDVVVILLYENTFASSERAYVGNSRDLYCASVTLTNF